MSRPRAVVVVTGSELVRGDRPDLNGPFLARELLRLGFEPARIVIVGDQSDELEDALATGLEADLCVVSGGLGPTHDDRTIDLLARASGRTLVVDGSLEREIGAISRRVAERLGRPFADFQAGVRKQATLPQGALSLGLAGTAPGVVLQTDTAVAVALPGPPRELQRLWPAAVRTAEVQRLLAYTTPPHRRVLRFYGVSESQVARVLAEAGGDGAGVEATVCARDFEIHVDLVADEADRVLLDELERRLAGPLGGFMFSTDERPIEELVLSLCREQSLTLATAESCTGGLVAARLTGVPGSSDVFRGSSVAYANELKALQLGVSPELLARHGAVSAETAAAMARGARERLGADVALAVTGVAGPGGGTREKPVGLVHLHAEGPAGESTAEFNLPGDRETVRRRATVGALHLGRQLLQAPGGGTA